MSYEYRVCWRREHEGKQRTRLYQTRRGADDFAHFIERQSWDEIDDLEDWAIDNLRALGDPSEVWIEQREVSVWAPCSSTWLKTGEPHE